MEFLSLLLDVFFIMYGIVFLIMFMFLEIILGIDNIIFIIVMVYKFFKY